MTQVDAIWRSYYQKALSRPHLKRTEFALQLNESTTRVAIDCGCGTGSDVEYLAQSGYQVYGFDINQDSVMICQKRFEGKSLVEISQSSFESFDYPKASVVLANSSLFFAQPELFASTWQNIETCLEVGGIFAGDFMGERDSWASNHHSSTTPLSEQQVFALFDNFEIVRFFERDERAPTSLGVMKHWHTYSVVAIKR